MSATDQVGAVIAFLVPFGFAYLLYRLVFAVRHARQRKSLKRTLDQALQRARDRWVADPLSWIALEDAMGVHRLETIDQWRERCR
jgi:hypothetical protein